MRILTTRSNSWSTLSSLVFQWTVCTLSRKLSTTFCFSKWRCFKQKIRMRGTPRGLHCRLFSESRCLCEWLTRVRWSITVRECPIMTTLSSIESISRKSRRKRKKLLSWEKSKSCKASGSTTSTTLKKHCLDYQGTFPKWADWYPSSGWGSSMKSLTPTKLSST